MSASKQNIEDIDFIIHESNRLREILEISYDEYRKEIGNPPFILWHTINPPHDLMKKDSFKIYLSDESIERITRLSKSLISSNHYIFNITHSEAINLTKEGIYRYIYELSTNDNEFNHTKLLNKVIKLFEKTIIKEQSLFFPCNLNDITSPITFGKIEITPSSYVSNDILDTSQSDELKKRLSETKTYIKFNLTNTSNGISQQIASAASNLLKGIFSIFSILTGNNDFKLRTSVTENLNFQFYLSKNEESNKINPGYSRHFGPHQIPEEQLQKLIDGSFGRIASECITRVLTPKADSILIDRLVDSIIWFGDAHYEDNHHSKIIKAVTALERIVTYKSDPKNEISKLFNTRVTYLANRASATDNQWSGYALKLYKLRSDLVHGSYKIHQSYDLGLDYSPMLLCAFTIVSAANLFSELGLSKPSYEAELKSKLAAPNDVIT